MHIPEGEIATSSGRVLPPHRGGWPGFTGTVLQLTLGIAAPAAADAVIFVTTTEQKISSNDTVDKTYKPGCSLQEAIFSANLDDNRKEDIGRRSPRADHHTRVPTADNRHAERCRRES